MVQRGSPGPVHARCPSTRQKDTFSASERPQAPEPAQNVTANRALLTASSNGTRYAVKPCTQFIQETSSWLSLATRSKASVEILIRYLQSSPAVGSSRITS